MNSEYDLLIVGAGAGGIGAAHAAQRAGLHYCVLEASHRVGGRGLTEELAPGIPWDLGCHWLHSASINPLVNIADQHGINYDKKDSSRAFYMKGDRVSELQQQAFHDYMEAQWQNVERSAAQGKDVALADLIDYESPLAPYFSYWQSLMTSADVDRFSALDMLNYEDTDENWPVREGYGELLKRHAEGLPIKLNTQVEKIDMSGSDIRVTTNRGTLRAGKVVVTVSTGVLGARDIQFTPELPLTTQEAIASLPLGCYNNFAMLYDEPWPFDADTPERIDYSNGDDINFAFKLKCSGWPYIYCAVAGRQAQWLERQPTAESEQLMMSALVDIFGADFKKKIVRFRASAWGDDPFIKGAYSASRPGCSHLRKVLAEPIDKRLCLAGEAASERAFCTAHGAWQSGRDAVEYLSGNVVSR